MMIPLSQIAAVAPQAGLPRDKTALIRRLQQAGAVPVEGRGARGQMCKLFPADALPKEIAALLPAAMGLSEGKVGDPEEWQRYYDAPQSLKDDAASRLRMVRQVAELVAGGATKAVAFRHVAAERGISAGTVKGAWRIVQKFNQADWLPALVKHYVPRERTPLHPEMWRYFLGDYARVEEPQLQAVWERTCAAAAKNGWGEVPCAKTLKRHFDDLPAPEKALLRKGEKALDACFPRISRDPSDLAVLERVYIDSRTLDIFVKTGPDGRASVSIANVTGFEDTPARPGTIRISVAMAIDARSRHLLGWEFAETENTDQYRRLLLKVCTDFGMPKEVWFDNTRAAANKTLTGGARNRFRFKSQPDDVPGILVLLGIRVRFIRPFNGRSNPVERAHGEIKERAEKHPKMAGAHTGRSPGHKPANYGESPAELSTVMECFTEAAHHYRTRTDRRGRVAYKTSYQAIFEQGLAAAPPRRLTEEQRRYFFLRGERCLVYAAGEVFLGKRQPRNRFCSAALREYAGQKIVVRFDPENLSAPIMAETVDGRMIDPAVPCIEDLYFKSTAKAREWERAKRDEKKHIKAAAKARRKMTPGELCAALPDAPPPADTSPKVVTVMPHLTMPKPAETTAADTEDWQRAGQYLNWSKAAGGGFAVNE